MCVFVCVLKDAYIIHITNCFNRKAMTFGTYFPSRSCHLKLVWRLHLTLSHDDVLGGVLLREYCTHHLSEMHIEAIHLWPGEPSWGRGLHQISQPDRWISCISGRCHQPPPLQIQCACCSGVQAGGELLTITRPCYTLTTLPHTGTRRSPALPIITELFLNPSAVHRSWSPGGCFVCHRKHKMPADENKCQTPPQLGTATW